ncbi:MAG: MoaD/ThiS family protein [Chloroflexi bacterium]|nr:MoaD/ThiS family protein [Chloroflexota bacterium]
MGQGRVTVVATVFIPPLLRDLTAGQNRVDVPGDTIRAVIAELDRRYPGIGGRLTEDGRLRPGMSLVVDNAVSRAGMRQRVSATSEVHFLPSMSGG